jgi:drug/metabolite transporter (DMT)-like permease
MLTLDSFFEHHAMPRNQNNAEPSPESGDEVNQSMSFTGSLLIITSAGGFSTLAILGKVAYSEGLNLPSILFFRFLGTAILLWIWLFIRKAWHIETYQALKAFLLGLIGYAIQATIFFSALAYASAGLTTLLFFTYPAFVTLLIWVVEKEHPDSYRKSALILSLTGCVLTINFSVELTEPLGLILGIASGFWYALYLMFGSRLVQSVSPVVASAYLCLGASLSFFISTLFTGGIIVPQSMTGIWTLISLSVIATALSIVTLFTGIQKVGIARAAIISTIEPVITVMLGIILLHEKLWNGQVLGGFLIVIAVVLANLTSQDQESQS